MSANIYAAGSIYLGGNAAFTGNRFLVPQSAVVDFVGNKTAVTTALSNLSTVQGLSAPSVSNPTGSSKTRSPSACSILGSSGAGCSVTITGPQSYSGLTIDNSAGTCAPFAVNLNGNITLGNVAGSHGSALIVLGNAVVNFSPDSAGNMVDSFEGDIDLSGQTGGCFGLGTLTSTTTCAASSVAGTYYTGTGSGSYKSRSLTNGSGSMTIGHGTFWSGGDLSLTGSGNVNWNTS